MKEIRDLSKPSRKVETNRFLPLGRNGLRSDLAQQLHLLIIDIALNAPTERETDLALGKLDYFLENTASKYPSILLEDSLHKCSHLVDALHLPFSDKAQCSHELRARKATAMFTALSKFCRQQAEHNAQHGNNAPGDITWEQYAKLMTKPNEDKFTPLMQCMDSRDPALFDTILRELQDLCFKGHLTKTQYAEQLTAEGIASHSTLMFAVGSGNREIYEHLTAELYQMHAGKIIDDATYTRQFLKPEKDHFSPLSTALSDGGPDIYDGLVRKLKKLHKEKRIDSATYAHQFTHMLKGGFTPLHEAIFAADTTMFKRFMGDLKDALRLVSHSHDEAVQKMQEQLLAHSSENWNVFHCATKENSKLGSPNPLLINALLDEFHEAFGDKARGHIEKLYREETRTSQYRPAFHNEQPEWLIKLLSLSDTDPIRPSPRYR